MRKIIIYIFTIINIITIKDLVHAQVSADAAATGISRAFNPAISLNSLFYGMGSSKKEPVFSESALNPGLHYQEISLEMTANVDIYLKSLIVFSVDEGSGVGLEEAYLTTLRMPIPVILRGGKMFNTFGRHNLLHTHHMAFAEPPFIHEQVFGPDLNEVSVEASYLIPVSWYMDAIAGILNGNNPYLFNSSDTKDLAYLLHLDNLWDFSDEITLRLGGSYLLGKRGEYYFNDIFTPVGSDTSNITSHVWGLDFDLRWRPLQYGRYKSFRIQGEYINTSLRFDESFSEPLHGFFIQILRQFDIRYWIQLRYDWFERAHDLSKFFPGPASLDSNYGKDLNGKRLSFAVGYVPTEFSAYRIQYNWIKTNGHTEHQFIVQVNVTIGSHPAHKY
jgi:hypothetical protein